MHRPISAPTSIDIGLGVPLESDHPALVEAIFEIRDACKRNGVAPGIHTSGAAGANQRIEEGFQFLALASELKYMLGGLRDDINQLNWRAADAVGIDEAVGDAVVRY